MNLKWAHHTGKGQSYNANVSRLNLDLLSTTLHSVKLLWEEGQTDLAFRTLQQTTGLAHKQNDFVLLHDHLFGLLPLQIQHFPTTASLLAFVLCRARKFQVYLQWLERHALQHPVTPELQVVAGWARYCSLRDEEVKWALDLLQKLEGQVSGWFEGLRLRVVGQALGWLKEDGWQPCFQEARKHLSGPPLGLCIMEEGSCHHRTGQVEQARSLWAEALPLLKDDATYHAWLRYNLGIASMGVNPAEAEHHFLELEALRHRQEAKDFLPAALRGLGSARRVLGELARAISCYRQALRIAREDDDREQALWGIGRTLVQAGQTVDGLAHLQEAHNIYRSVWLNADLALAHLQLGDLQRAEHLARTVDLKNGQRSGQVALLVLAEIHRRKGQQDEAVSLISQLDFKQWHLREDRRCLEVLFQFAEGHGFPQVPLYGVQSSHTVQVQAEGVLRVRVNGRFIPIKPSSKPAELLVRLLERGGQDTLDSLLDALFREQHNRKQARQALWNHVQKLRTLLGWEDAVLAPGGAFVLDPNAHWDYDIDQARAAGRTVRGFLEGVYSEWVLETQQDLGAS